MSVKTPIRTVFDSDNNATGLAEFQSGEFIGLTHGGLGASLSIGSAGQILKVNSGGSALEFGNVEAVVNIDGATDLTSSTLVAGDQILLSDGGTEGRVTLSQIDTLFSGTSKSLTNKNLTATSNTFNPITIVDDSSSASTIGLGETLKVTGTGGITSTISGDTLTIAIDGSIVTESSTDTLTNKTLTSPVISQISNTGTLTLPTSTDTLVGRATTDTLTNKTINTASNTITVVEADISDLQSYILADSTDTLTNKSINLSGNTLTGTTAQFNSALSDGSFTTLAGTETLTNKTLTSPTITGTGAIAGTFTGNVTGDVTGNADTATTLATARTIAGQSFDGSANITIAATDLSDTNQSLATSDNVTFANLTLSGNLTVNGTTTTVSSTNTTISDNLLELNSGAASNANDTGILIERGSTGDNAIIAWDESADKFTVGTTTATADSTGNISITTGTLVANIEGNLTGNVTGDVTGNADTATTLATARTIGGVSFNGSANINLPGVNTSGNQDTSGNAATATALETARTIAGQSFDGTGNITIASTDLSNTSDVVLLTSTQTLTNKTLTSPTITGTGAIAGTFTGDITGDVTGNADTATTLATARTIAGQSFDGSANITIASTDLSDTSSIVLLTSSQTLTNKQLTSPKINENVAVTATATELNFVDGVTSAIQTQLDNKAAKSFAIAQSIALG
jgi:hypothetical protein